MAKRKREDEDESVEESAEDWKRRQISKQIALGVSKLTAALEQARRFERQKLGKRQHDKKRGDVDGRRLNVEIAVLKTLDMRTVAEHRLHKNLIKTKSIAKTGLLPEDVKLPPSGAIDKPTADLMARLFKQSSVADALDATMSAVRKIVTSSSNDHTVSQPNDSIRISSNNANNRSPVEESPELSGEYVSESEEFTAFDDRIASSSADEDAEESRPTQLDPISGSESVSESVSELESEPESDSDTEKPAPRPSASAFLPSLSMAGYMSGSDSDATDVEEHVAPRKNRRGQRARQAIWEKKFKEKAKHLKSPAKKKDKRDEGWDVQRGAVSKDDTKNGRKFGAGKRAFAEKHAPSGGNSAPLGNRKDASGAAETKTTHRDDAGALHPSWLAKKQMKQQSAGIGGFKGKKITFD